jgi:hypothetical protein
VTEEALVAQAVVVVAIGVAWQMEVKAYLTWHRILRDNGRFDDWGSEGTTINTVRKDHQRGAATITLQGGPGDRNKGPRELFSFRYGVDRDSWDSTILTECTANTKALARAASSFGVSVLGLADTVG